MDFQPSEIIEALRDTVRTLAKGFPQTYWREVDKAHRFPHEFFDACASAGLLGMVIPEEYGGSGLGVTEVGAVVEEIMRQGIGTSGCAAIHTNMFSILPLIKHGTPEQKQKYLPLMAEGKLKLSIAITEPNAGIDTTNISTFAKREGDRWIVNGHKIWISAAQHTQKMLLLARTTPRDQIKRKTDGVTLFFADINRSQIELREIEKLGRAAVDSNEMFIDGLEVLDSDRIGEVGEGFKLMHAATNPERILVAAEAMGIGICALNMAVEYAKERIVFGRPIGMNQGVQFPLAESYAKLTLVELMVRKAEWLYDNGLPCAAEANIAKLMAVDFATEAMDRSMVTMGGYAYAKEYDIERWFRELRVFKLAPIPEQMILAYLGEHVLGLPRSF